MDFEELLEFAKTFGIVPDMLDVVELQTLFAEVNVDEEYVAFTLSFLPFHAMRSLLLIMLTCCVFFQ